MASRVFFCYAHEDEPLLNKLKAHLKPLQEEGLVGFWYDRDINAGKEWEQEILEQLDIAQIILLLVSPDFMSSKYCYGVEMQRAMELHQIGEAIVIPIILRPVYWQSAPFNKLQALPKDAKPVKNWRNMDKALLNIVEGIRKTINQTHLTDTFKQIDLLSNSLSYKFRSSLEARWGVFFDCLGIEYNYEYKPLRFELNNTSCLPDFYLPAYPYFLKITASQPTFEDKEIASSLALYANTRTYLLAGDIWLPINPSSYEVIPYGPITVLASSHPMIHSLVTEEETFWLEAVDTSLEVRVLLQMFDECNITVKVEKRKLSLSSFKDHQEFLISKLEDYLISTGNQHINASRLTHLFAKCEEEMIEIFESLENGECGYFHTEEYIDPSPYWTWCQCSSCGKLDIVSSYIFPEEDGSVLYLAHTQCSKKKQGVFLSKTPDLIAAYRATRQIRILNVDGTYVVQPPK